MVGFVASITLLPTMLALAGRRGLCKPDANLTKRFGGDQGRADRLMPSASGRQPHLSGILAGC